MLKIMKKIAYGPKADSDSYIRYLRKKGMTIGERTRFYAPMKTLIDITRPWLIEIGDDVQITEGVTILTHGYDWSVLKGVYGEVLGSAGKVHIGNNVFIGVHSIILKGVTIGNNVIIGAGSLVNNSIPDNCVVAGNPAKIIMTLEDYYKKRKKAQMQEAEEMSKAYKIKYGKNPGEEELSEFFWLFSDGSEKLPLCWMKKMELVGNLDYSMSILKKHKKNFNGIEEFFEKINRK